MSRLTLYNTDIPPLQPPAQGSNQVTIFAKDKAIYSVDEDGTVSGPFGGPGAAYRWSILLPTYFQNLLQGPQAPQAPQPVEIGFPVSDPAAKSIIGFSIKPFYNELEDPLVLILYVDGDPTDVTLTIPAGSTAVVSSTGTASVSFESVVWIAPEDQQFNGGFDGFVSVTFSSVPVPGPSPQ